MTFRELKRYIKAAGGKRAFAYHVDISERYVEMLEKGQRKVNKRLEERIRMKIAIPIPIKSARKQRN